MIRKQHTKFVHEGQYIAEVDVELLESEDGWSPCLSVEDAEKLDDVKKALKQGNLEAACKLARVFRAVPIAA